MSQPVEVVVAHQEAATLRAGDVFLEIDGDQVAALPGSPIARPGHPATASPAAWRAAGAACRRLHEAPVPPWPGRTRDAAATALDEECRWLLAHEVLPHDLVTAHRQIAEAVLERWTPVFAHNDLQVAHVFVTGDEVTGVIDWTEPP